MDKNDLRDARVALYCRVSQDASGEGKSVSAQEEIGRQWVTQRGAVLAEVYRDNSLSASVFARKPRKSFLQMREDVEAGKLDVLWFWELSRAARDMRVFSEFLHRTGELGVLWSVNGSMYDPNSADDVLTLMLLAAVAQSEAGKLSERVKRGKLYSARNGMPSGKAPYGYRRIYDPITREMVQQEPDVDEHGQGPASVVREVFERVATGHALYAIARDLNERGIPSGKADRWRPGRLRRIVLNRAYIGQRVYHRGEDTEQIFDAVWPPLVTEDVYWACRRIVDDPARRLTRPGAGKKLLTSIPRCGVCGDVLRTRSVGNGPGQAAYTCTSATCTSIVVDELDRYVTTVLLELLTDPDVYAELSHVDDSEAVVAARGEVDRAHAGLEDLYRGSDAGEISPRIATGREERLKATIAAAELTIEQAKVPPVLRGNVGPHARERWAELPLEVQRRIISEVLEIHVLPSGKGHTLPVADRVVLRPLIGPDAEGEPAPLEAAKTWDQYIAERRERAVELRRQGLYYAQIAEVMGVSTTTVRSDVADTLGVAGRHALKATRDQELAKRRQRVVELRRQGLTFRQIGVELGITTKNAWDDAQAMAREEERA